MMVHVFLVFTLIFLVASLTYFILYESQYMRIKEIEDATSEVKNTWLIIMLWIWFAGLVLVLCVVEIILYCLIITNSTGGSDAAWAWADAFTAIGVINYVSCICFLFVLTIGANSVWIKVKNNKLYFLDEIIELPEVEGIVVKRLFKRISYRSSGEVERKIFITKRVFNFLKAL